MRALAITNEFPLPLDRGGPVRFYGLARALAERHDVHLLALRRPSTTLALVEDLESTLGGPVEVFDRSPPSRGPFRRWIRAIYNGVPPWIAAQFSPQLARRARELADEADVAVLLDDYAGIYAAALAPLAPVVADKSNVMGWSAAAVSARGSTTRIRRRLAIWLIRRFERRCLQPLARVVVTSGQESERLEALYGRPADAVVPSAIDLPKAAAGAGRAVGWLGSHEYDVNVEGLLRFVYEGWAPTAPDGTRLRIAGGSPPPSVLELERLPDVEVLGYVERLDEFLASLAVAVVPLWRGAGVKVKTLTLMGAGIPVAATPVALEGIDAEHGRHCLVADEPPALAAALRALLDDPARARRMGEEARALIAQRYTWRSVTPRFSEAVERAAAGRS